MLLRNNKPAILIISAGLLLIILGYMRGEFRDVLYRGISICLDCMGLVTPW